MYPAPPVTSTRTGAMVVEVRDGPLIPAKRSVGSGRHGLFAAELVMSTIRVLRVIARMNVGGPALQVCALADGLDPARFEQRLLVGEVDAGEADYLALRAPHVHATKVRGLGRSPDPTGDLRALNAIRRAIYPGGAPSPGARPGAAAPGRNRR